MMGFLASQSPTALAALALAGLAAGFAVGLLHFGTLGWTVSLFTGGGMARAALAQILRFAVLIAVLYGLARLGALALLCGGLGILIARRVVVGRVREAP